MPICRAKLDCLEAMVRAARIDNARLSYGVDWWFDIYVNAVGDACVVSVYIAGVGETANVVLEAGDATLDVVVMCRSLVMGVFER